MWLRIAVCLLMLTSSVSANDLYQAKADEAEYLLLDIKLGKRKIAASVDAYAYQGTLLISADALLNALGLKYRLYTNKLEIWRNQEQLSYKLITDSNKSGLFWQQIDGLIYLDQRLLQELFNSEVSTDLSSLLMTISDEAFKYPITILAEQADKKGVLSQQTFESKYPVVQIEDQYQLWGVPHGLVSIDVSKNHLQQNRLNLNLQTTSDLLYHSTSLTLNESNASDLVSRLNFSRYKTLPDKKIMGLVDQYSFGDINSYTNNLTSNLSSGVGINFLSSPDHFRRQNLTTTIEETAPPGWEAELYLNGELILIDSVPQDGNLVFRDVATQFGANHYQIKLYGPYGESEVRNKYYTVDSNALEKGEQAYSFYALDPNKSLLGDNDTSWSDFNLTNIGFNYDYGVTDAWQVGLELHHLEDNAGDSQQFLGVRNALSFPGFLFENELSINDSNGYAQQTSITGNAFGQDTFNLSYQSANKFNSGRIQSNQTSWQQLTASYSGRSGGYGYNLALSGSKILDATDMTISSRISKSFAGINFSNNLSHRIYEDNVSDQSTTFGQFLVAGRIDDKYRLNGTINYKTNGGDFVDSVAAGLSWAQDLGLSHSVKAEYRVAEADAKWQLSHNMSWYQENFRLTLSTLYDEKDRWSINAGIRFYMGYDRHNKKLILSNRFSSQSATLDLHNYLDRNPNGWRDEYDYDLSGMTYSGTDGWENLSSGETGRVILPGVPTLTPFKFSANTQFGNTTLKKDYVVYTHPGAYVEMNMPFYLLTEYSGFVLRKSGSDSQPVTNAKLDVFDRQGNVVSSTTTDRDGFYEIPPVKPGIYRIALNTTYLREKGLTGDITGIQLTTPQYGGFIELPALTVRMQSSAQDIAAERTLQFEPENPNTELLYWAEDEKTQHHFFNLTPRGNLKAQSNSNQPDELLNKPEQRQELPNKPESRQHLPTPPETRNSMGLAREQRTESALNPITRNTQVQRPQGQPNPAQLMAESRVQMPIPMPNGHFRSTRPQKSQGAYIQYGVYKSLSTANELRARLPMGSLIEEFTVEKSIHYRLRSWNFDSVESAYQFARQQIGRKFDYVVKQFKPEETSGKVMTKTPEPAPISTKQQNSGWVIQFAASPKKTNLLAMAKQLSTKTTVYLARKRVNNQTWYCLISRPFNSKITAGETAKQFKDAWIINAVKISDPQAL